MLAESVAERVPEIGVRMALGADRRAVIGMVLSQGGCGPTFMAACGGHPVGV